MNRCFKIVLMLSLTWSSLLLGDKYATPTFDKLIQDAENGDKEASYKLAEMYEYGKGVDRNVTRAMQYYKKATAFYEAKTVDKPVSRDEPVRQGAQTHWEMQRFFLSKVDKEDPYVQSFIERYLNSDFGLYTYRSNYFLPFSLASASYPKWTTAGIDPNDATFDEKYETEFQMSVQKPISFDWLGMNEAIVFAYTQRVWWQLYSSSAPFRETNYEPELFITFPTSKTLDERTGLKGVQLGFVHESNGRGGVQSRSWNRLYLGTLWQSGNLFAKLRAWYRIPEERKLFPNDPNGDDNPNIEDYLGYGDLSLSYLYKKHQFGLLLRNNLHFNGENRGAVSLDWSYPMNYTEHSFWYFKVFSGYGESLIDYDRYVNKIGFGLSFSRGIF